MFAIGLTPFYEAGRYAPAKRMSTGKHHMICAWHLKGFPFKKEEQCLVGCDGFTAKLNIVVLSASKASPT